MRRAQTITVTDDERRTLEAWARGRRTQARLVLRAKIVLRAADGMQNCAIAAELATAKTTVIRWRKRFAAQRLAGIEKDAPRPAKRRLPAATVEMLLRKTTQETPENATHWSTRTMAKVAGVSRSSVSRLWRSHGLQPHRVRTFKLSNDPRFVEKMRDIVGLYLDPPANALVLSCDEKSQIQALDRSQPSLPLKPGRCGTLTHDYRRNGTTTLFAAIELAQGKVIGSCMPRHRHQEWIAFLKQIDAQTPPELDLHLIVDNYATHKHPKAQAWLKRHRRFHLHFTPTSSSWLNLIERWFREITQKRLRRGVFKNVPQLVKAIEDYIAQHNALSGPFAWTAQADAILAKVERARAALEKTRSV